MWLGTQPEHAIAGASEHRITARICPSLLDMVPAIDLDHEPLGGQEVSDEATE